jgi:putative ABC transport system ATP-binding protein
MSGAPEMAVRVRGLTKVYGAGAMQVTALRGVDLDVEAGSLAMIVGPSGCGKTTLISVIAGILGPTAGTCEVLGSRPAAMDDLACTAWRARNVGFVFQQFNLLPTLTAAENAAVPLMILGWEWRDAVAEARAALGRLGLGGRTEALPSELSGGQQQRVAIARALVHRPRLVVCDEPTSALDHHTGQRVMELFREVADRHDLTLVVVTHDARIFRFADRIARMDDGRVVDTLTPDQAEREFDAAGASAPIRPQDH